MVEIDKSNYKILLVEDDFINGKIVKTLLEKASYNVEYVPESGGGIRDPCSAIFRFDWHK